jgi:4-hydroxy-tetrahydrodipicolinate reductase
MTQLRVAVSGVAGRMGRASARAIARESDLRLVAAVGRARGVGEDAGVVTGAGRLDVAVGSDFGAALAASPDVLVEFAPGRAAVEHARAAIDAGVRPVIGSTGLSNDDIDALTKLAAGRRLGAVIAPNFAIGAVLMMEFARIAARFMPYAEIIELHHDRKRDAPSGTAVKTAQLIAEARGAPPALAVAGEEMLQGARGATAEGVPVHSVRLPGLNAHQEVVFGGLGQILTLRHDSLSEESFMPGVILAVRRVPELTGLVYGMEHLLGLR